MNNIIILIFIVVVVVFVMIYDNIGVSEIDQDSLLKCNRNDPSCALYNTKDILTKCDSFCSKRLGNVFSHTQNYKQNQDGSIDCKCVPSSDNNFNNIGTPSINVPFVDRSHLPSRAGEVEHLTNTNGDYDKEKDNEYKRFGKLIFG